jgi:NADH-quinone oxidoreductase subunit L
MLFGTLAITGVPFFSGFYSKDLVLATALEGALEHGGVYWIPSLLGFITAGLTAFYMWRLMAMTFWGKPRDHHVYEHAHEAPPVAYVPLLILATLCLGFWWHGQIGIFALPFLSSEHGEGVKGWLEVLMVSPVPREINEHLAEKAHLVTSYLIAPLMLVLGFGVAMAMYIKKTVTPERLLRIAPLRGAYTLFSELWYIDRLYQDGIVVVAKAFNRLAWRFDDGVIDRWMVDGWALVVKVWSLMAREFDNWVVDKFVDLFGWVTWLLGALARTLQAGKIQYYVCVTFGVVIAIWLGLMLMVS